MIRVGRSRSLGAANAVVRWLFELSDGAGGVAGGTGSCVAVSVQHAGVGEVVRKVV
jgi:hypothetical protein